MNLQALNLVSGRQAASQSNPPELRIDFLIFLVLMLLPSCQQQMAQQPSGRPDQPSAFFADGRQNRPVVAGTVARGQLRTSDAFFTGLIENRPRPERSQIAMAIVGQTGSMSLVSGLAVWDLGEADEVNECPIEVTPALVQHGRDRYMIFCVVCHDPAGTGRGKIVERGYTPAPSYHSERLRKAPIGHFFRVITEGYGSMPDYHAQITPRDRWAIATYIRALQVSQHFPATQLEQLQDIGPTPPQQEFNEPKAEKDHP